MRLRENLWNDITISYVDNAGQCTHGYVCVGPWRETLPKFAAIFVLLAGKRGRTFTTHFFFLNSNSGLEILSLKIIFVAIYLFIANIYSSICQLFGHQRNKFMGSFACSDTWVLFCYIIFSVINPDNCNC